MKIKIIGKYLGGPDCEAEVTIIMPMSDWDKVLSGLASHLPNEEYEQPLYVTLQELKKKAETVEHSLK